MASRREGQTKRECDGPVSELHRLGPAQNELFSSGAGYLRVHGLCIRQRDERTLRMVDRACSEDVPRIHRFEELYRLDRAGRVDERFRSLR